MVAKIDPDLLKTARKQWQQCADAETKQRERIVLAKKFRALDQWPEALKLAREGGNAIAGMPATPARPCFVVDRLNQPMRQISNQIANADFAFDVKPDGGGADTETAEIIKGHLRRIDNQARSDAPVEWAADGAIEGGIGWFRLRTKRVHQDWQGPPTAAIFDQELCLERITNNLAVYCDPWATDPTRATARFMFVTEDISREAGKDEYGDDLDLESLDDFAATGDCPKGWVTDDTIRRAEWWRVDYVDRRFCQYDDGTIHEGAPEKGRVVVQEYLMRTPKVKCSIITANQELRKFDWVGLRIPLFPVLGEELNIDGKSHLRGIIEPGMDAQRMVNYTYSSGVEIFALNKKAPMIPGAAVQNYKSIWQTRTLYNYSYLPYDQFDGDGRPLNQPMLDTSDAPIMGAVELMRVSEDAIKASTNTGDASLGNTNPNERSGRALAQLQASSDLANSNYPNNVRRALIACANEAVYVLPRITRKGQVLQVLGVDDEIEQVMVGQPFRVDKKTGIPTASPPEVTPELARVSKGIDQFYDLNNGTYSVTVTVGKASATKREEGAAALGELIPHLPPEMAAVATPDYVEQLSFPGSHKIAEKLRKALPPQLQEQEDQEIPPQAQGIIAQLQSQIAELQPLANDNAAKLEMESRKQQGESDRHAQDLAFQERKLQVDSETKLAVAELSAKVDRLALFFEERARLGVEDAQAREAQAGRDHERSMASSAQAHERGMTDREAQIAADAAEGQRAHETAMAAQRPAEPA